MEFYDCRFRAKNPRTKSLNSLNVISFNGDTIISKCTFEGYADIIVQGPINLSNSRIVDCNRLYYYGSSTENITVENLSIADVDIIEHRRGDILTIKNLVIEPGSNPMFKLWTYTNNLNGSELRLVNFNHTLNPFWSPEGGLHRTKLLKELELTVLDEEGSCIENASVVFKNKYNNIILSLTTNNLGNIPLSLVETDSKTVESAFAAGYSLTPIETLNPITIEVQKNGFESELLKLNIDKKMNIPVVLKRIVSGVVINSGNVVIPIDLRNLKNRGYYVTI